MCSYVSTRGASNSNKGLISYKLKLKEMHGEREGRIRNQKLRAA
jgi:hypothetical protein